MGDNSFLGMLLAGVVLVGLFRLLGPKTWRRQKRNHRRVKRVKVHPLLLKERKLAAELRHVRAQLREQQLL